MLEFSSTVLPAPSPDRKDTQEDENRMENNGKPPWQICETVSMHLRHSVV